jgi:hypothetical protein
MNHSTPSFPTASASTFPFVNQNMANQTKDRYCAFEASNRLYDFDPRSLGVREAARQRWEELKPLIQRVYIEEDRPYPYLANLLLTQHGFETTYDCKFAPYNIWGSDTNGCVRKRQFSRKIAEWGFRKNVSSSERRGILQSLPDCNVPSSLYPGDPRLKPEKLRSWRKRYRDDVDEQPCHFLQPQSSALGEFSLSSATRAFSDNSCEIRYEGDFPNFRPTNEFRGP